MWGEERIISGWWKESLHAATENLPKNLSNQFTTLKTALINYENRQTEFPAFFLLKSQPKHFHKLRDIWYHNEICGKHTFCSDSDKKMLIKFHIKNSSALIELK